MLPGTGHRNMKCNSNLSLSTFEESHLRPRRAISASARVNITCVHDSSQKRTPSPQCVNVAENYSSIFRDIIASARIDCASLRAKLCNHDSCFLLRYSHFRRIRRRHCSRRRWTIDGGKVGSASYDQFPPSDWISKNPKTQRYVCGSCLGLRIRRHRQDIGRGPQRFDLWVFGFCAYVSGVYLSYMRATQSHTRTCKDPKKIVKSP